MTSLHLILLVALLPAICLADVSSIQIVSNGKYVSVWPNDSRLIFVQYNSVPTQWTLTPVPGSTSNEYTVYDPATGRYWRAVNSSGFRMNLSAGPASEATYYFKFVPITGQANTYNIVSSSMQNLYNYYNGGLSLTSCECEFYFNGGQTFVATLSTPTPTPTPTPTLIPIPVQPSPTSTPTPTPTPTSAPTVMFNSIKIVSNGKYVNVWPNDSRLIFVQYTATPRTWTLTPVAGSTSNEYTVYDAATSRYWRAVNSSGFRMNLSAGPASDATYYFKFVPVAGQANTYNIVSSSMQNLYNYYNGGLSLTSCECEFYFNGGQTFQLE